MRDESVYARAERDPEAFWAGFAEELDWFVDHPCPPDTIGANYYVTSDRLLDHRVELYPAETHGGNGRV